VAYAVPTRRSHRGSKTDWTLGLTRLCWAVLAVTLGCRARAEPERELPPARPAVSKPTTPLVVAHGGQGSPAELSDGPEAAVTAAHRALQAGASAVDAAVAGMVVLEDDPRFNAGTGANLRLDGRTIECDAAVMSDDGTYGAVAGLPSVKNPVLVAQAVSQTPHVLLAGAGADAFATTIGVDRAELGTELAKQRLERALRRLMGADPLEPVWLEFDWRARWNFPTAPPGTLEEAIAKLEHGSRPRVANTNVGRANIDDTKDTVGVVLRTADGRYVAALSTGGTTLALRGRVGDVPIYGAGLYAGPAGAVAATGVGEAIMRAFAARDVYALLEDGVHPREAIRRVMIRVPRGTGVGMIAVSSLGFAARATSEMAWAMHDGERVVRADENVWYE